MDMQTNGIGGPPPPVIAALQGILRPLIRFLLGHGITYPLLSDLLKATYVEVARSEFTIAGKPQTDSRISLLTGVHRKDVKRLVQQEEKGVAPAAGVGLGSQLVARWLGHRDYLNPAGEPLPLARLASEGGDKSFESLVESVSKDIRSRVILDEWLRLGIAQLDSQDRVCLNVAAFVPERGFEEKLDYFRQNIHDHMAAAVHNLSGLQPPFFERSVFYDQLAAPSVEELRNLAADAGMQALQTINRRAMTLEQRDADGGAEAALRINYGVYFYAEPRILPPMNSEHTD